MSLLLSGMLYQVTTPRFCGGVIVAQDGVIIHTAPCFKGWRNAAFAALKKHAQRRGWKVEETPQTKGKRR